jgi:hypothetical protein
LLKICTTILGTERSVRVASMRAAINDTFPEPNRRLLQRYLSNNSLSHFFPFVITYILLSFQVLKIFVFPNQLI